MVGWLLMLLLTSTKQVPYIYKVRGAQTIWCDVWTRSLLLAEWSTGRGACVWLRNCSVVTTQSCWTLDRGSGTVMVGRHRAVHIPIQYAIIFHSPESGMCMNLCKGEICIFCSRPRNIHSHRGPECTKNLGIVCARGTGVLWRVTARLYTVDASVEIGRARVSYPRGTHEAEATGEVDWWGRTRAENITIT